MKGLMTAPFSLFISDAGVEIEQMCALSKFRQFKVRSKWRLCWQPLAGERKWPFGSPLSLDNDFWQLFVAVPIHHNAALLINVNRKCLAFSSLNVQCFHIFVKWTVLSFKSKGTQARHKIWSLESVSPSETLECPLWMRKDVRESKGC